MPWLHAADIADLAGRDVLGVTVGERKIAVYRLGEGVYATSDACPHLSACLSRGEVVDGFIECPAHFALFDIRTGQAAGGVTSKNLVTYPAKVEEARVYVFVE